MANPANDLQGLSKLVIEAVAGVTDIVEDMHRNIAGLAPIVGGEPKGSTGGVTGFVYGSVRGITRLVGVSLNAALVPLAKLLHASDSASGGLARPIPGKEPVQAALNGVLGDYLASTQNPLAISMSLRSAGVPLVLTPEALLKRIPMPSAKLLVMVHGLCMNDLQWLHEGHDHGAALAQLNGASVVYLHYNTGLHISHNGRDFSETLETLVAAWPCKLKELTIIAHSMGGLVTRSALYYAEGNTEMAVKMDNIADNTTDTSTDGSTSTSTEATSVVSASHLGAPSGNRKSMRWPALLKNLVFLGTPHQGAPLEKAGHGLNMLLGMSPYTAPFGRLAGIRSAGIKDLRSGNLIEEHWNATLTKTKGDTRIVVTLPPKVNCYAVAASSEAEQVLKNRSLRRAVSGIVGDGLVPVASALGAHRNKALALNFPPERQLIVYETSHFKLLSSPSVYQQLKAWLK